VIGRASVFTAVGLTSGATGKIGNGLTFDGGSLHYATMLMNSTFSYRTTFTLSMWMKRSAVGTHYDDIFTVAYYQPSVTADGWEFYIGASNDLRFVNQNVADVSGTGTISDTTTFHHVAISYNSGTVKFYIDGALVGTASPGTMSTNHNPKSVWIGTGETDATTGNGTPRSSNGLRATLDQITYIPAALLLADIAAIYNDGNGASSREWTTRGAIRPSVKVKDSVQRAATI
jgi:hypothetical protein